MICAGRKPSTLSTASSVRRSRTLMLIALAMTSEGARGSSRDQIETVLHLTEVEDYVALCGQGPRLWPAEDEPGLAALNATRQLIEHFETLAAERLLRPIPLG